MTRRMLPRVAVSPASHPLVWQATACRFVVIEDDTLLCDLLATTFEQRFQPAQLHRFNSGRAALQHCLESDVDLIFTDLHLPDVDGREIIRAVRARDRKPRIIVLTGRIDNTLPAELIALGVAGFIDKGAPLEHAVRAVERVLAGGMYFFAGVMPSASSLAMRGATANTPGTAALTPREREVARLVAGGLSSKEIAQRLELSTRTVENYRAHLMHKLGVRDTANLVRWCLENGLA